MQTMLQSTIPTVETPVVSVLECRICGHSDTHVTHTAREMMFGLGEDFRYLECSQCGCLQLMDEPEDPAKYYGPLYYAHQKPRRQTAKAYLRRCLVQHAFGNRNLVGALLSCRMAPPAYCEWFRKCSVTWDSAVLDVGCGNGRRILNICSDGFSGLTGIDPWIQGDIQYDCGVRIYKRSLREMNGRFDLIMLHHAFEHMNDPADAMKHFHRLLRPGGYLLIRIPVAQSYAWRRYGVYWVQLDAPRHYFLHTPASMAVLADESGFRITDVTYDSCEFQFWGSEQYKKGIPLMDKRSYAVNPRKSVFSKKQIKAFQADSALLNKTQEGDSACFILRRG